MKLLKDNAPFALFAFNVVLALGILLQATVTGGGYRTADPVLDLNQADVTALEFRDERGGMRVTLTRGEELPAAPESESEASGFDPGKAYDRLREDLNREARYDWTLAVEERVVVQDEDEKRTARWRAREFQADAERVEELFKTLGEARRYYSVNRTPEKDRELEMGKNDRGEYDAPTLVFRLNSGAEKILYLGRTRAGASESYVRVGEDERIYLVETDLRTAAGEGDALFFRDRSVWPRKLGAEGITGLDANFPGNKNDVVLVRAVDGWRITKPEEARARSGEVSSILSDLVELKAEAFLTEAPDDIEKDTGFDLEISYKDSITGTPRPLRLEILGKKDYSTYYVRRVAEEDEEAAPLMKITSVYLGDFYEPERKLVDRAPPGAPAGGKGIVPAIPLE